MSMMTLDLLWPVAAASCGTTSVSASRPAPQECANFLCEATADNIEKYRVSGGQLYYATLFDNSAFWVPPGFIMCSMTANTLHAHECVDRCVLMT